MNNKSQIKEFKNRKKHQSGAVLYVVLVLIVVMGLLGVVGLQVASLEEKMVSQYLNKNRAFQNAEADLREAEYLLGLYLEGKLPSGIDFEVVNDCKQQYAFSSSVWGNQQKLGTKARYIFDLTDCLSDNNATLGMGQIPGSESGASRIYQITQYSNDDYSNPKAEAVVEVIYIP